MRHSGFMKRADLSAGLIEYTELGEGRPLVFVHGILAGPEIWHSAAELLSAQFRCIMPVWPLGLHRLPISAEADMSPAGLAEIVAEFIAALDLTDVVLVGNDSGGAICQLVAADHRERIGALILTNCDALEVFPPPIFSYLRWSAYIPGGYTLLAHSMRWMPFARHLPFAWGGLTAGRHSELFAAWSRHLAGNRAARRDAIRFIKGAKPEVTLAVADRLEDFAAPTLLLWGADDRFFKATLAERLSERLPNARLDLVQGAKTFVVLDQPEVCADRISRFLDATATTVRLRPAQECV